MEFDDTTRRNFGAGMLARGWFPGPTGRFVAVRWWHPANARHNAVRSGALVAPWAGKVARIDALVAVSPDRYWAVVRVGERLILFDMVDGRSEELEEADITDDTASPVSDWEPWLGYQRQAACEPWGKRVAWLGREPSRVMVRSLEPGDGFGRTQEWTLPWALQDKTLWRASPTWDGGLRLHVVPSRRSFTVHDPVAWTHFPDETLGRGTCGYGDAQYRDMKRLGKVTEVLMAPDGDVVFQGRPVQGATITRRTRSGWLLPPNQSPIRPDGTPFPLHDEAYAADPWHAKTVYPQSDAVVILRPHEMLLGTFKADGRFELRTHDLPGLSLAPVSQKVAFADAQRRSWLHIEQRVQQGVRRGRLCLDSGALEWLERTFVAADQAALRPRGFSCGLNRSPWRVWGTRDGAAAYDVRTGHFVEASLSELPAGRTVQLVPEQGRFVFAEGRGLNVLETNANGVALVSPTAPSSEGPWTIAVPRSLRPPGGVPRRGRDEAVHPYICWETAPVSAEIISSPAPVAPKPVYWDDDF